MSRNRTRRPIAILVEKNGKSYKAIGCPFCKPPHELRADGTPSICGTFLRVEAVQNIYFEKNIKCIVCGMEGGTMIKVGDSYRHVEDCVPGKRMYANAPKLTKWAELAWKIPDGIKRITGIIPIQVSDKEGKILGYTFDKP